MIVNLETRPDTLYKDSLAHWQWSFFIVKTLPCTVPIKQLTQEIASFVFKRFLIVSQKDVDLYSS